MRKILTLLLLLPSFLLAAQKTSFSIRIIFHPVIPAKYIYIFRSYERKIDTLSYPASDTLIYTGTISKPGLFQVVKDSIATFRIWVDSTPISITVKEEKKGSRSQLIITDLEGSEDTRLLHQMTVPRTFTIKRRQNESKADKDSIAQLWNTYYNNISYGFIDSMLKVRPESPIIPFYIIFYSSIMGGDTVQSLYSRLPEYSKNSEEGNDILEYLQRLTLFKKGGIIDNFKMPGHTGKDVTLHSIKAKYILLDFWASWCGPCRAENPALVRLYQQYHEKGFEIISVSLDESKDKWLEAIKKDGLNWYHVSDLKGRDNILAVKYKIGPIPFSVLLDSNYKVIEIALRTSHIESQLATLSK